MILARLRDILKILEGLITNPLYVLVIVLGHHPSQLLHRVLGLEHAGVSRDLYGVSLGGFDLVVSNIDRRCSLLRYELLV